MTNLYSEKVALRDVNPMIWRRLRLKGDTSLAAFHYIIQRGFGCDDQYLHEFRIFGKRYGINKDGAIGFSDDAYQITIDDFEFDMGDRITYCYNFYMNWVFDIRIEEIEAGSARKKSPFCISGKGMLETSEFDYCDQLVKVLHSIFIDEDENLTVGDVRRKIERLDELRFNRNKVNQQIVDLNLDAVRPKN